ncbi:TMTC1 [Symbiodinium pilosum]|uniref:TMTC1 protein n=1 Tax=Symbiodinium pilosum TaxID=2952 RepID=A0A812V9H8_SYMPI|nr:TMTC1 [Symbiodinium pilosum]
MPHTLKSFEDSLSGLGTALYQQGRYKEAEDFFRAAVTVSPKRPQAHENLALSLERSWKVQEAVASLRMSLSLAPKNVKALNFLGELLTEETNFREAEQAFRDSLAVDPTHPDTHRQLADALLMRQAYEEATVHLAKAMEAEDSQGGGRDFSELGYALEFTGRDAEAEALYREMLVESSDKSHALSRLGRLLISRGNYKEAEELLHKAIQIKDEDPAGYSPRQYRDLGSALYKQGKEEEAREVWRKLLKRLQADGLSLVHFNTNFAQKEDLYKANLQWDVEAFEKRCEGLEEALQDKLLSIVRAVRRMENSSDWLLSWAEETTRKFGGGRLISYGVTYFGAWRAVISDPMVIEAMKSSKEPMVMLVGSALGYQCAFALSLGFERCVGYDLLCDSMVSPSQKLVEEAGLSDRIQFHCADALTAPELKEAALVWVNDDCFPRDFSRALTKRMAETLPSGSVFLSYKAGELEEPHWHLGSTLTVEVSWNANQFLHIFRRKSADEAQACAAKRETT